jgi:hypothetical protein
MWMIFPLIEPSKVCTFFVGLEAGFFAQAVYKTKHAFTVEHAGDVMADNGGNFPFAGGRQIAEQRQRQFASDGGEGVSIEEKKRRATMKATKPVEYFAERQRLAAELFPVRRARC